VEKHQHRLTNQLTVLHLAIDGMRSDDTLSPEERRHIDEAHAAVEELTETLLQGPPDGGEGR
jgi:hypothetical protein